MSVDPVGQKPEQSSDSECDQRSCHWFESSDNVLELLIIKLDGL